MSASAPAVNENLPYKQRKLPPGTTLLVTVAMAFGGCLITAGRISARFDNLESRVETIEATYVPARVHAERDKMRDEQVGELRDQNAELNRRLTRIEEKLDRALQRKY